MSFGKSHISEMILNINLIEVERLEFPTTTILFFFAVGLFQLLVDLSGQGCFMGCEVMKNMSS